MSAKPTDLMFPSKYGDKDEATRRLNICDKCEFFTKAKRCNQCGCFMVAKTKLKDATCPMGKW